MMYSNKFVRLIRSAVFFAIIWVIVSIVLVIASFIVFLPFIILGDTQMRLAFISLYLLIQVFFTSAYMYAIIDSVKSKNTGGNK